MTDVAAAPIPPTSLSIARTIGKIIQCIVAGWTVFCAASFVLALINVSQSRASAGSAIGTAFGVMFWGAIWIVPVIGAELLAIGLLLAAGKPMNSETAKQEWRIAFLLGLAPNLLLAVLLVVQMGSLSHSPVAPASTDTQTPMTDSAWAESLRTIVVRSGRTCTNPGEPFHQGSDEQAGLNFWNLHCSEGQSYIITLSKSTSPQVVPCESYLKVTGRQCFGRIGRE